jgi:hypothetical protein
VLTEENIKLAKETLAPLRGNNGNLSRWAFLSLKDNKIVENKDYICVAGLNNSRYWKDEDKVLLFSFNGEAPRNTRGFAPYGGGELSKRWLEFLLGPETPFPGVVKHIHNKDEIDEINETGGFIFSPGYLECGAGELRGFLIASRYAQEQYDRCVNWDLMVQHVKLDPIIAWMLSMCYLFAEGWIIMGISYAGHSVFYEPPGLWFPNLYKREFPYDVQVKAGSLSYCNNALYLMDIRRNPVYEAYNNSWASTPAKVKEMLYFNIDTGDNVKQAEEKVLAILNKDKADG